MFKSVYLTRRFTQVVLREQAVVMIACDVQPMKIIYIQEQSVADIITV